MLHFFMTVLVKFQIEIRFSIELHGNSKLSMTSCPPSSEKIFTHFKDKEESLEVREGIFLLLNCSSPWCVAFMYEWSVLGQ